MKVISDFICLYVYLLHFVIVVARKERVLVGHFKVSARSPEITQCAAKVLHKEGITEFRLYETHGSCETTTGHFDDEKLSSDHGYGKMYAKKWTYNPPVKLGNFDDFGLNITGMFYGMNRMDVYVTWPEQQTSKGIIFSLKEDIVLNDFMISIFDQVRGFVMGDSNASFNYTSYDYERKLSGTKCMISFAADESGHIKIELNGNTTATYTAKRFPLERVNKFMIDLQDGDGKMFLLVHSVEFSEDK